jgi:hypothetical protein
MKRRGPGAGAGRSYLSQMAEPVLAGEQALSMRRRGHGWEARDMGAVPQEAVEVRQPARNQEIRSAAERNAERDIEQLADAVSAVSVPPQRVRTHENIAMQDESRSRQANAREESSATVRMDANSSNGEPLHVPRSHPTVSHDVTQVFQPEAVTQSNPAKRKPAEIDLVEAGSSVEQRIVVSAEDAAPRLEGAALRQTARREERQREQAGEEKSDLQKADHTEARSMVEAWPHTAIGAAREPQVPDIWSSQGRQQRESGTTIHIGTVEVRTVVHRQEPATVVAQTATMTQPPAPATGPLARSLNWRYGLVQG